MPRDDEPYLRSLAGRGPFGKRCFGAPQAPPLRSLVFDIGYWNTAPLIASRWIGRPKPSSADSARPSMDRGKLWNY